MLSHIVGTVTYQKEIETVWLDFATELPVGEVHILIDYTGTLNDQMRGFYRSKYTINGEERHLAVTLFEVSIVCFLYSAVGHVHASTIKYYGS